MTDAGSFIRVSRLAFMGFIVVAPLFGPGTEPVILMLVSAVLAYDGLKRGIVYGMLTALVGTELTYGMDVGVLSVAYIVSVLLVAALGKVMTITSVSSDPGWRLGDGVRSWVVACGFFAALSVFAVIIGGVLYGYGDIGVRLHSLTDPRSIALAASGLAVALVMLRRIDEPFRRRIVFGI